LDFEKNRLKRGDLTSKLERANAGRSKKLDYLGEKMAEVAIAYLDYIPERGKIGERDALGVGDQSNYLELLKMGLKDTSACRERHLETTKKERAGGGTG